MNITCIICSDLFLPYSEVYTTNCGHLFHYHCLAQWIERSKSCPQCRAKTTESSIRRIYFNLANTDAIVDDVGTLQLKLDNMQLKLTELEKDVKRHKEKYDKTKNQNLNLRHLVSELESKMDTHKSVVIALKDQVKFFKSKSTENDKMSDEIARLKNELRMMDSVQLVINGTREEVNSMLTNEHNMESLTVLVAVLKKTLIQTEEKKNNLDSKHRKLQNEMTRLRREMNTLESTNKELKNDLEVSTANWQKEKEYLTKVIAHLKENKPEKAAESSSKSNISRILSESPAPLPREKPSLGGTNVVNFINLNETNSPFENKVQKIVESTSPYLPVKTNSVVNILSSNSSQLKKFSIFKNQVKLGHDLKLPKSEGIGFNGLGGISKDYSFPTPKSAGHGLKRPKSSTISSNKFKKLAPVTIHKK